MKYSQPEFYKFNQDSIFLANLPLQLRPKGGRVLDLCAGSGVIGLEYYMNKKNSLTHMTFIEKQKEFEPFLRKNIKKAGVVNFQVEILDFSKYKGDEKFDLIFCNPPFFAPDASRRAKDPCRNLCRQLIGFTFEQLASFIKLNLRLGGEGYFICRETKVKGATLELKKGHFSLFKIK